MMPNTLSNSPTKTKPETTIQPQSSTFPPKIKEILCVSQCYSSLPEKMSNPIAIGTKGTVGSLVMQEIEYFNRLDLNGPGFALARELSRSKRESVTKVPGKKKRRSKKLIPSMCSTAEVAESNQQKASSKWAYMNLKADVKRKQP